MNNELKIRPLMRYEVQRHFFNNGNDCYETDVFTGDDYEIVNNENGKTESLRFYRAGNVIREYIHLPMKIIVTPADDADIPA